MRNGRKFHSLERATRMGANGRRFLSAAPELGEELKGNFRRPKREEEWSRMRNGRKFHSLERATRMGANGRRFLSAAPELGEESKGNFRVRWTIVEQDAERQELTVRFYPIRKLLNHCFCDMSWTVVI
jgi:hypothetical protein